MNKSFLSVSPSEGEGNAQVVINVKENVSLDERSESLNIRTSNGVERRVRIIQDPGMIFFPTMKVYGIQVGQGEKKFAPLDHYPVISPQSDKNWLVDSINIWNLLSSMNGGGLIAFRLRILMRRSFFEEFFFEVNQGGSTYALEDKRKELEDLDRQWYLKDDWSYAGCNWDMNYEGYEQNFPSATLDYDNGEGEYKTLFEWRFSAGSIDILPQ